MLSKWGDAFIALSAQFAGKESAPPEIRQRILMFRVRIAHWFSLMSCMAFATLRARLLTSLEDVPICEMFGEYEDGEPKGMKFTDSREDFGSGSNLEDLGAIGEKDSRALEGLSMVVLSAPTREEVELLDVASDKVNTVYYWVIQGVIEEIRAKSLDTPPPIVSRFFQEISNGKMGFRQAHKVAMVPFPFPFAQMVSLLLMIVYFVMPLYIECFTMNRIFTPFLCFTIPVCYCGLNRVAVELEEPFGTDWNDVDIEVRHEEFLMMLVDVLRANTSAPCNPSNKAENKILKGICQKTGRKPLILDEKILRYVARKASVKESMGLQSIPLESLSPQDSQVPSETSSQVGQENPEKSTDDPSLLKKHARFTAEVTAMEDSLKRI
jgi:hypothetical protein